MRKKMIECNETRGLYFNKKCELLKVPRSSMYYKPKTQGNNDFELLHTIRDIYAECPMYGYRRIHVELRRRGIEVNHKRVQRVLSAANIKALYPMKKKNTSIRNLKHKVYPYLLDSLDIKSPNQAWSVDITYIKIRMGFVYLVCLIDTIKAMQKYTFVLYCAPQSLYILIVNPSSLAIHTNSYAILLECVDP